VDDREKWKKILERIGAAKANQDELQKITGIDAKMEKVLISNGVNSYLQISKLTAADIPVMAAIMEVKKEAITETWFREAAELAAKVTGKSIMDKTGVAQGKDDLKKIKGISDKTEAVLHKAGITTYEQLSKLTAADIPALAEKMGVKSFTIKESWVKQAQDLIKK